MELHPVQKHVFRKLAQESSLPYSALKPGNVESNQFTYHLKKMQQRGYVKKVGVRYSLTTQGIRYTTGISFEYFSERIQPKVMTLVVCRNAEKKYLVYTRSKQPFLGMVGFPFGKIHMGEKVQEAAERELLEKSGLRAKIAQKAIAYILARDAQGEILTHMICHVFFATKPEGELLKNTHFGTFGWASEAELRSLNLMPGAREVLSLALRPGKTLAFEEYEFEETE